jgi:hypothetical protein
MVVVKMDSSILYREIDQSGHSSYLNEKCFWCGEYFKEGDKISIIVIAFEYKKIYKNLSNNIVIHKQEFDALVESLGGDHKKIVEALGNHKQRRVPNELTEAQKAGVSAFKYACKEKGFYIETNKNNEVHMRKHGTSLTMEYNSRTGSVRLSSKVRKKGMFDGLYSRQIEANIYNRMQEIIGTELRDNYSVTGTINKVIEETNKIMGR